ncbi:MAG: hypothetical protein ABJC62_10635 [Frankiaceae bacterium]
MSGGLTLQVDAANYQEATERVTRAEVIAAAAERIEDLDYEVKDATEV